MPASRTLRSSRRRPLTADERSKWSRWLDRLAGREAGSFELNEDAVRQAWQERRLRMAYQLVTDIDGVPAGAKAVLRIVQPTQTWVEAGEFLDRVTDPHLARSLADFVLSDVVEALPLIRAALPDDGCYLSFSASAAQLEDRMFASRLASRLDTAAMDASGLVVELCDPETVSDWDALTDTATELRHVGVVLAIEDAGEEPGDLIYRDRCGAEVVRLDRQLVSNSEQWAHERTVVDSTVKLCREVGHRTIAQGVESDETLTWLRDLGVDYLCGRFIAWPEPLDALLERLEPAGDD